MKTLKFSQDSWHFKTATQFGGLDSYGDTLETDFCRYVRKVLLGMFVVSVISLVMAGITATFGDTFAWIAAMVVQWAWIEPSGAVCIPAAIVSFCIAGFVVVLWNERQVRLAKKKKQAIREQWIKDGMPEHPVTKPGFLKNAWYSFKNKTCFKVEIA